MNSRPEPDYLALPDTASEIPAWNGFTFDGWNAPLLNVPLGPGQVHRDGVHKGHTAWDQQYRDVGEIRAPRVPQNQELGMHKWVEEHYGLGTARWYREAEGKSRATGYAGMKVAVVALMMLCERFREPVTGYLDVPVGAEYSGRYRLFLWKRDLGSNSPETGVAWRLVKNEG